MDELRAQSRGRGRRVRLALRIVAWMAIVLVFIAFVAFLISLAQTAPTDSIEILEILVVVVIVIARFAFALGGAPSKRNGGRQRDR